MRKFSITLGLGRMASHHEKTFQIDASTQNDAVKLARAKYYEVVQNEIGKDAPIWGKILTVSEVNEIE